MIDQDRSKRHGHILLCLAAACHQVANVNSKMDLWKVLLCSDAEQQKNDYDCGVYTVLNAHCTITGEEYHDVVSEHARSWIGAQAGMHKNCACKQEKQRRTAHSFSTKHHKLVHLSTAVEVVERPMAAYLVTLSDREESRWSTCPQVSCKGDFSPEDTMVFCCVCRGWYHVACLPPEQIPLPVYYICDQCSNHICS